MLTVRDLRKTYGTTIHALQGVDLTLDRGIFGMLGPNGAGKSTLMRTLATLQLPDAGTVMLDDLDVIAHPRAARRRIGYLPQEMGVYPRVTAREMLEYLAGLKGIGPRRVLLDEVERQLDRVNLLDVANRRVDTYSGGMRQRFGIAAAFLGKPDLVIVDEPTAGLDPHERRRFQLLLSEAARNCVLILSSHIVEDIAGMCEQMAIMDDGRIVATGDPQQLVQELHGQVWEVRTELDQLEAWRQRERVLSWKPQRGRLVLRLWSERDVDEATQAEPDLEDLYALRVERGGR